MRYVLHIYSSSNGSDWDNLSEEEQNAVFAEYGAIQNAPGVVGGDQLQPASTVTTVRVQDGQTLTTDGPFAETKEVLGGYYLIDVATLDEALEWAAKIPSARCGHIEVRPIVMREAEVAS